MKTLDRLRLDPQFMSNISAWERLPARKARYAPFPAGLSPRLVAALRAQSIDALYSHQAQAVEAALRGRNVAVVTGTASGKTLCYNLPVLQILLADSNARALYLFPTKALAQDQAHALGESISKLQAPIPVHTYDGDTPQSQRAAIRKSARVIISRDAFAPGQMMRPPGCPQTAARRSY